MAKRNPNTQLKKRVKSRHRVRFAIDLFKTMDRESAQTAVKPEFADKADK